MSVLITGASGRVGTMLRGRLGDYGWTLRYLDRVAPEEVAGEWFVGDINDPAVLGAAFDAPHDPVTAVVHLGGQPTEAPWPVIRAANIDGTHAVFEAARTHGVRRIVYASSNHAVGFTPHSDELRDDTPENAELVSGAGVTVRSAAL